ncbi:MAG: hypothetical protein GX621_14760 [Pirellulaceae bacterium]|nr:hypothetical protein [Pirellulaceae bacterium]
MFEVFLVTLAALTVFMLALGLGAMLGRRKRECSCRTAARIMATKKSETKLLTIEWPGKSEPPRETRDGDVAEK